MLKTLDPEKFLRLSGENRFLAKYNKANFYGNSVCLSAFWLNPIWCVLWPPCSYSTVCLSPQCRTFMCCVKLDGRSKWTVLKWYIQLYTLCTIFTGKVALFTRGCCSWPGRQLQPCGYRVSCLLKGADWIPVML